MIVALYSGLALVGVTMLIAASLIGRFIVRAVDQDARKSNSSKPRKVNNFVDFAIYANSYSEMNGSNFKIYLAYILATSGSILFVGSVLLMLK